MTKKTEYSEVLQAILQGHKFKAVHGINGILNIYQLEEQGYSMWLFKYKSGIYRTDTGFCVDTVMTKGDTLVLTNTVLGKRAEITFQCGIDLELIND
jgi:hypothetical protein